jgi:probable phosphoglycerate mutase
MSRWKGAACRPDCPWRGVARFAPRGKGVVKALALVRHGALAPNPQRRFIGVSDLPLSDAGRTQMRALAGNQAKTMGEPAAIFCSDLARSKESAAILAAAFKNVTPHIEPGLREINLGRWEMLSPAEVRLVFPGQYEARGRCPASFRPEGGESFRDLRDRVLSAHAGMRARYPEGLLLIAGHAGVNRTLIAEYLALPLADLFSIPQPYACISLLEGW